MGSFKIGYLYRVIRIYIYIYIHTNIYNWMVVLPVIETWSHLAPCCQWWKPGPISTILKKWFVYIGLHIHLYIYNINIFIYIYLNMSTRHFLSAAWPAGHRPAGGCPRYRSCYGGKYNYVPQILLRHGRRLASEAAYAIWHKHTRKMSFIDEQAELELFKWHSTVYIYIYIYINMTTAHDTEHANIYIYIYIFIYK